MADQQTIETWMRFFDKHALGPLAAPSCFMCGETVQGLAPIKHLELRGIVGCQRCLDASIAARQLPR